MPQKPSLRVCLIVGIILLCLLVLGLFALFVWPTAYRYDRFTYSGISSPVRINRFTGTVERLLPSGWHEMKTNRPAPASRPPSAVSRGDNTLDQFDRMFGVQSPATVAPPPATDARLNRASAWENDAGELTPAASDPLLAQFDEIAALTNHVARKQAENKSYAVFALSVVMILLISAGFVFPYFVSRGSHSTRQDGKLHSTPGEPPAETGRHDRDPTANTPVIPIEAKTDCSMNTSTPPPIAQPPSPTEQGVHVGPIIRDVAIVWILTAMGGFVIGIVTGEPSRVAQRVMLTGMMVSNLLFGTVAFTIAGCLAPPRRWRHLGLVAVGAWLTSFINVVFFDASIPDWIGGAIFLAIIMGLGGAISYVFKGAKENSVPPTVPRQNLKGGL